MMPLTEEYNTAWQKKTQNITKTMCACLESTTQWNKDVLYLLFARITREYKNNQSAFNFPRRYGNLTQF